MIIARTELEDAAQRFLDSRERRQREVNRPSPPAEPEEDGPTE